MISRQITWELQPFAVHHYNKTLSTVCVRCTVVPLDLFLQFPFLCINNQQLLGEELHQNNHFVWFNPSFSPVEPVLKDTSDHTGATLESPSSAAHYVAPSAAVTQVCVIMSFTAVNPYHDLCKRRSRGSARQSSGSRGANQMWFGFNR